VSAHEGLLLERDRELERIRRRLRLARRVEAARSSSRGRPGSARPSCSGPLVMRRRARASGCCERACGAGARVRLRRGAAAGRAAVGGGVGRRAASLLEGPPGVAQGSSACPGPTARSASLRGRPDPSFAMLHGLYWLFANLAAEQPMALVVDDAHWVDSGSLRFLAFLLPGWRSCALPWCWRRGPPRRDRVVSCSPCWPRTRRTRSSRWRRSPPTGSHG